MTLSSRLHSLLFALLLAPLAAPASAQAHDRLILPGDLEIRQVPGSPDSELAFTARWASQNPAVLDLSMDAVISVNGSVLTVDHIIVVSGGTTGNCSAGGPCPGPCPQGSTCVDYTQLPGGTGCGCDVPVYRTVNIGPLVAGDLDEVQLDAAPGAEPELFTLNDAQQLFYSGPSPVPALPGIGLAALLGGVLAAGGWLSRSRSGRRR